MRPSRLILSFIALYLILVPYFAAQDAMKPPIAKKVPKVLKIHGYEITDNYGWLRDRNEKKNPEIIKYLEDNNKYTESFMGQYQGFVDNLYKEMLGRIKQDDTSVPYKLGDYWYFTKTEEGKQYPTFLRSKTKDGANPEVLLDQNELAKGFKFYSIGDFEVSDDGNLLAYTTDTTGYRQYTLHIKDLKTGKTLDDKVERVTSAAWSNDGKYLFVGQEDPVSKRSDKIWRHEVGTNKDALIFEEKDVLFNTGVGKTRDHKMLFIGSSRQNNA
jgi:oligopeptidase B